MFGDFKSLIKQTSIYGIGAIINPLISFIMLPLYTHYLSADDYGVYALAGSITMFLTAVLGLGVNSGLVRIYFVYDSKEERDQVIVTSLIFSLIATTAIALLIMPTIPLYSKIIFNVAESDKILRLVLLTIIFNIAGANLLAVLRAEENAKIYTVYSISSLLLHLGLNIIFVAVLKREVLGIFEAGLIASVTSFLILIPSAVKGRKFSFSFSKLKEVLLFGSPLIPALVADMVLSISDRYFLESYISLEEVGVYSIGYRIAAMLTVVVNKPFKIAWPPFMFKVAKQDNAKEIYKNVLVYYVFAAALVSLGLSLFAKEVLILIATPEYYAGYKVVPLISLSYLLFGMVSILIAGIHITKKTKYASIFTIISAVIHIILNFLLIPSYGMMGAAVSTIIAYLFLNISIFRWSQKLYYIEHDFKRIYLILTVAVGLYVISLIFKSNVENLLISLLINVAVMGTFPLLLYSLGFFKKNELATIKKGYDKYISSYVPTFTKKRL